MTLQIFEAMIFAFKDRKIAGNATMLVTGGLSVATHGLFIASIFLPFLLPVAAVFAGVATFTGVDAGVAS